MVEGDLLERGCPKVLQRAAINRRSLPGNHSW
jgi:hypothetical protein